LAANEAEDKAKQQVREGNVLFDAGKYEEAKAKYEAALQSAPEWYEPHFELAQTYWAMKQFDSAKKQYDEALKRQPDCGICFLGVGNLLDDMGKSEEALPFFLRATELLPKSGKPPYNAAVTYLRLGRTDNAIAQLKTAEQIEPTYASPFFLLGNIFYKQGKLFPAFDQLFQAAKLEPKTPRAEQAKKLTNVQVLVDTDVKDEHSAVSMAYCVVRAGALSTDNYRKRKPNAETYEGTLDDELEILKTFATIVTELNQHPEKKASKYQFLTTLMDADYLAPYLLVTAPERFAKDRERFEADDPARLAKFSEWAAEKKIPLEPLRLGCEVKWMGRTW